MSITLTSVFYVVPEARFIPKAEIRSNPLSQFLLHTILAP